MDSFAFDDSFTYFPSCSLPPPSSSSSFDGVSSSFSPPDHHNSTSSSSRFPLLPSFSDSLENSSQSFWPSFSNSQHPSLRSLSSCPSPSGLPASPILSSSPCPGPPNSSLSSLSFSQQSFSSVLKSVSQRSSPSLGASSPPPSLGLETSISKEERHVFLPSPFSLHDFAHLPFLCSRVYVQFAADGVLPPEVKLALRHPHGYEYTVREPRGGSTSKRERRKEVKHEETSPSRPSIPLCPSQPSSSHTESSAPESRLSSSPVGCTDTCTSRGRPDGGATGGASSVSKNHDSCDCSSCRLSRAIEEAAKILRPYGVSIVRDSRLLGHSDYPRAPSEAPSQTPNAFLPLTPPSLPLNTKSSSSSISSSPSSPQLALVPYSSPCKEVSLSALLPGRSSFSTCSSSSTSSSAPPVVGMLIRKTAVTSSRQHRETGSDAPSSSPSSSSSSSPSLSSFPPDIVHEVVRELKKGLTCFVLRGAPPVTPLPGVRTPAPPASSPSTSKAISVSTAIKREKLHSKTGDLRGDAQGKGRARTAGGVSSTENGDPHASSTSGWGEASRGLKSSFDGDCEVLEGWIDAILQLHDMEDEDRQTLVVTNHYAGIFSHKRAVLTHTSYEFGSLLFRDPALKFSSVYGSRNADDSCSSSSTKTTSRKSSRAEPGGGASFWSSSGQKGTRSEVNEVLQLIPGFLLKTLFFDGATSQVRPLLRFLRRHASVSLSLTTGGGMLGGGPGSSVNSCAYFSSFREAASAVLSSSSSSQSRRPSTRARRKEENEERKEEGSEEEDEESEGEKKDATRSRMPESAGPHSKNKHHTSLNGSEGSASHLDAQERTTKKPLKVFLVISTFPMRHSRVRVARTDIDDRIAEDVTTRKATRRLRIRGSLLPRSLERILRAFTLLTSSSSSSCCSSSFSLQHSSSFSSFSSTSSLPADSSSNIPCLSKGDSKAFPNKTRQEEKVDEVSAPQYYLKDLSLLFSFKAHPHAGAPFADEELALCLPSQLVSQQFSRFGWLLQQKHSSVYTRLRSLLPPSSWAQDATASQLADSGVATKESLDGGSSLLGKGAVLSGGLLALTAGDEVEEEEERWREVSEAITSFCMMMLQNSLDLKKNFPILCRPIVEVRQVLQWLKRNNKPQIQGLRLCTSLYPYRFHTASGQASSASSASALLTLLKDLSPEHFISQHYLHLVSTFSSLLASQSTTIDKQKAPGLLLKGGEEEEEQRGAPFIMHVDLFGVCRPSWIRELKALTRSFEGNQYLSISWKQGQRGVSDYLLWIGSPSPPSPLSRSEEMLRSVLCTALSSRDSCGPLLKSECILDHVKDLETAVCQLKQRRPSIEERDSSLHEAKRLHRVNVYAAITSQRLLRLLSSSFSSSSSSTSSPPKNADSSVTTSAFRPVQQQGVFRSLQKDLRDLNRLKETQKSRGIDVQIHLVSPGWAYECYHMGSLRPSTGPLYYLDVLVEKKVASIKEENLEKEKENVTASKTSTSHRSPQSIPSVASLRGKQKNRSVSSSQEKKKAQEEEDDQLQDERKKESLFSTSSEEEEEDHPQEKRRTDTESSKQEENEVRRSGRETIHGKREGAKKIEAEKREENSDEKTQEISICKGLTLRDEIPYVHVPLWGWLLFVSSSLINPSQALFLRKTRGLTVVPLPSDPLLHPTCVKKAMLQYLQRDLQLPLSRLPGFIGHLIVFAAVVLEGPNEERKEKEKEERDNVSVARMKEGDNGKLTGEKDGVSDCRCVEVLSAESEVKEDKEEREKFKSITRERNEHPLDERSPNANQTPPTKEKKEDSSSSSSAAPPPGRRILKRSPRLNGTACQERQAEEKEEEDSLDRLRDTKKGGSRENNSSRSRTRGASTACTSQGEARVRGGERRDTPTGKGGDCCEEKEEMRTSLNHKRGRCQEERESEETETGKETERSKGDEEVENQKKKKRKHRAPPEEEEHGETNREKKEKEKESSVLSTSNTFHVEDDNLLSQDSRLRGGCSYISPMKNEDGEEEEEEKEGEVKLLEGDSSSSSSSLDSREDKESEVEMKGAEGENTNEKLKKQRYNANDHRKTTCREEAERDTKDDVSTLGTPTRLSSRTSTPYTGQINIVTDGMKMNFSNDREGSRGGATDFSFSGYGEKTKMISMHAIGLTATPPRRRTVSPHSSSLGINRRDSSRAPIQQDLPFGLTSSSSSSPLLRHPSSSSSSSLGTARHLSPPKHTQIMTSPLFSRSKATSPHGLSVRTPGKRASSSSPLSRRRSRVGKGETNEPLTQQDLDMTRDVSMCGRHSEDKENLGTSSYNEGQGCEGSLHKCRERRERISKKSSSPTASSSCCGSPTSPPCCSPPLRKKISRYQGDLLEREEQNEEERVWCCHTASVISFSIKGKLIVVPGYPGIPIVRHEWLVKILSQKTFCSLRPYLFFSSSQGGEERKGS